MVGARVFVEGIALGSTRRDGTLTAPVPSGQVRMEAEFPIDHGEGNFVTSLNEYFAIKDGEIVATYPSRLFKALAARLDRTIHLEVHATAAEHAMHVGTIAFRVGQSPLSVVLAAPPSNPTLGLSNIEVGISMPGAGIAVQRISDAARRFEIATFPHGTVSLECVAGGRQVLLRAGHLQHSGPQEVTLVLRHVDDLKGGVAPLRARPDDDARARVISPQTVREKPEARILLSSEDQGRTIATNAALTLPRGTERLLLAYEVTSTERRMDPRFSDVWTLSLFGDGAGFCSTPSATSGRSTGSAHPGSTRWGRTGQVEFRRSSMWASRPPDATSSSRLPVRRSTSATIWIRRRSRR
jgi:hypothetical protein